MKKILCVYVPFCSPVGPPYSLTYLQGFLRSNLEHTGYSVDILDLNAYAHKKSFPKEYQKSKDALRQWREQPLAYAQTVSEMKKHFDSFATESNKHLREGNHVEQLKFWDSCLDKILQRAPEIVVLSIVYNSQAFFAQRLSEQLSKQGIRVIVGGPAVTQQLKEKAEYGAHEVELLEMIAGKKADMHTLDCRRILDYSWCVDDDYATSKLVIPLRSSSCCYYQQCAFCTHHGSGKYVEYDLQDIRESVVRSRIKSVFVVDDMLHRKRLLDLAKVFGQLGVRWMCQLRPTKEFDLQTLQEAFRGGLRAVIWGVESGSDRVLRSMRKGTNVREAGEVIAASKTAGITTATYIMFGFPTETKEDFLATIDFLKTYKESIDLVSTSVFGLQQGAPAFVEPQRFGIDTVTLEKRTFLPQKVTYTVKEGLHNDDAKRLRSKYRKTLESISSLPKQMNMYREHMLIVSEEESKEEK